MIHSSLSLSVAKFRNNAAIIKKRSLARSSFGMSAIETFQLGTTAQRQDRNP